MSREEAITLIKSAQLMLINPTTNEPVSDLYEALEAAIKALSQEPTEICCATCKHERLDDINYKCEFQNECLVEGKRGKYEFAYAKYEPIVEQQPCDAISREDAIKALQKVACYSAAIRARMIGAIEDLPPVTQKGDEKNV